MSRPLLFVALVLVLGVFAGPVVTTAAALCAVPQLSMSVRGVIAGSRPLAAGLVVVRQEGRGPAIVEDLDAVRYVGAGQTPFPMIVEEVATDAWLLRPGPALTSGRYTLHGISRDPISIELTDTPVSPQTRPTVRALRRRRAPEGLGPLGRPTTSTSLVVELVGPRPSGALAIAEWQEDGERASTWGLIGGSATHTTAVLASSGSCRGHGRFPSRGARVSVRVLDLYGQLSEPSPSVRAP